MRLARVTMMPALCQFYMHVITVSLHVVLLRVNCVSQSSVFALSYICAPAFIAAVLCYGICSKWLTILPLLGIVSSTLLIWPNVQSRQKLCERLRNFFILTYNSSTL